MTTASAVEESQGIPLSERLAPSIPAVLFVFLGLFVPLAMQRQLISSDGDLARHIRHGLYMLQHHTLIWHDPFSFTRPGQPFVPFEYGSQLIYALVYKGTGLAGVAIFAGCLIAAVYALLARFLLRRGVDPLLVIATVAAAAVLGSRHWLARPHLISWLAIILFFGVVESSRRPPLWVYALGFGIWANLHGGWLYGIALLGIYLAGHLLEYRFFGRRTEDLAAARHFALALLVAGLATLATPMGLGLWKHLYVHLGDSYVINHTDEFASPNFHPLSGKILLAVLLGAIAALIASSRRMHTARFLLVLAGIWWSLTAVRNLPLFGLTGLAVVALHIDSSWRGLPGDWLARRRSRFAAGATRTSTTGWILACCGVLALVAAGRGSLLGQRFLADDLDPHRFPVAAVEQARAAKLDGRIFSDFIWGGYLLLAWPEQRVFIDGGTDFYGASVARDYYEVATLAPGWRGILDRWRVDAVLITPHSRLARELVRTPGWQLWYCDPVAIIARRDSVHGAGSPAEREQELVACAGPPPDSD